jgi:hypothetical protein
MSSKKVWVGVLNHAETKYIPSEYYEDDIYKGEDALPYFTTFDNCLEWCINKNSGTDVSEGTLVIRLDRKEARHLLNCLLYPNPKGEDLDMQLEIEDILANFLNATK